MTTKMTAKLVPMSATELFKLQVQGTMDGIRETGSDKQVIPAQFGGISGQRTVLQESEVIMVTQFDGGT